MNIRKLAMVLAAAGLLTPPAAVATDGYFSHGYFMKAKGRGGASMGFSDDTSGGANNPASLAFVGNRLDAGVDFFAPRREASRSGSGPANIDGSIGSESNLFAIPEFGYNYVLNPETTVGVTVYGNGGLNTNYPTGTISRASACGAFNPNPIGAYNLLCGNGNLGVDLTQLVVAPTLSYKLTENHALGIAPLIAAQRFEAKGLQAFQGFSTDPRNFTNNGHEITWGGGVRVGYQGRLTDTFTVGAAYSSPIWMQKFKDYQGLFAQQGGFDIPQNFSLGFKWEAVPQFTIGLDYAYIDYSSINSVNNPSSLLGACFGGDPGACLGGGNGAGFGWKSVNVAKLGFEYQATPTLLLRAGYNYTDNPIQPQDVTINILAPGVVQNHLTLGLTWQVLQNGELTIAYMHAFSNSVTGTSLFAGFGAPPTTTETIKMYENSFGIAYGWKL